MIMSGVKTQLRIQTEDGTYERAIPNARYGIVRRANAPKFFCPNCNELRKSDREESERGKPFMCAKCYGYMDRVQFLDELD